MSERTRYRVRLLGGARPSERGLSYAGGDGADATGDGSALLAWERVRHAFAAEVGEPEGVRTIVFDLLVDERGQPGQHGAPQGRDPEHPAYRAYRLDADPGEDAMALARAIERGLGVDCPSASIKSVATDGTPSRWYPDIESFEEAVLSQLD